MLQSSQKELIIDKAVRLSQQRDAHQIGPNPAAPAALFFHHTSTGVQSIRIRQMKDDAASRDAQLGVAATDPSA